MPRAHATPCTSTAPHVHDIHTLASSTSLSLAWPTIFVWAKAPPILCSIDSKLRAMATAQKEERPPTGRFRYAHSFDCSRGFPLRPVSSRRSSLCRLLPRPWWLLALALGLASPASAQAPGTWAPIADLNQARAGHTATLLANGTVLVAGGKDAAGRPLATAELYDPAIGHYIQLAASLPAPVWGHTATLLNDGSVLIAGGEGNGGLPVVAAQLFDPGTGTCTAVGSMATPRSHHTATRLHDGRMLVAGGTDGFNALATLEVYDPATRTFSLAPSALRTPRQAHTATLLNDQRLLVAGGSNSLGALNSAELYDPAAGTIRPGAPLNVPRTLASAALLLDGTVLVAGGQSGQNWDLNTAEVYNPVTNTFTLLPALMSAARSGHLGVQLLHNGRVLISGGTSGGQVVATAEVYDPVTGTFRPVGSPSTARQLFGANFFEVPYTGILLASGGLDGTELTRAPSEVFFYPTLRTDKPDYSPGEIVTLMGEGWRPNESISIDIHESSGDPDTNLTAIADTNGSFTNQQFVIQPSDQGVTFLATATGQTSGWTAQTTFTDHPGGTPHSTATTVSCSPNPVAVNNPTTCTATVTDTSGAAGNRVNPPGTVSFASSKSGTFSPPSCTLAPVPATRDQSRCSVTFTPSESGSHTITATYSGGTLIGHGPMGANVPINSSAGTFTLTVTARTTSTTLDCPDSTPANSPATCTVRVADTDSGTKTAPQGTVSFSFTSQPAGSSPSVTPCLLTANADGVSSSCTVMFSANTLGSYTIKASYRPSAASIHAASDGSDTIMVTARATSTTVECTPPTIPAGVSTTCTATVTDTETGAPSTPTGTVTFTSSGAGSFSPAASCTLTGTAPTATRTITSAPNPPRTTETQTITATSKPAPASAHATGSGTTTVHVLALAGTVTG